MKQSKRGRNQLKTNLSDTTETEGWGKKKCLRSGEDNASGGGRSLGFITLKTHTESRPGERLCQQVLWK